MHFFRKRQNRPSSRTRNTRQPRQRNTSKSPFRQIKPKRPKLDTFSKKMRNLSDEGRKFEIGEFRGLSEDAGDFRQTSLGEHATKKSKKEIWGDRVWCVFVYVYPLPGGLLWRGVVSPAGARVTTAGDRATACKGL